MKATLRAVIFRYMLAVIVVTMLVRLAVWFAYEAYEARAGHVVLHEQVTEVLLMLLVDVVAVCILAFMLWRMSRMLMSPLRSVANAATLIAAGKLDKRIRTNHLPKGELLEIAEALNASFDRYQDALDRISRFSSAAAHQLRTPITAIRTTAELSLAQDPATGDREQALVSILEETSHLGRMTEQLLLLARMEVEHLKSGFKKVDLSAVVRRVAEMYLPVLETKNISPRMDLAASCPVHGDETLLAEAITNLFDNAVKLSKQDGNFTVATYLRDGASTFAITDSGPGIDEHFRERLFERFTRHPATPYKGSGLGLSIVREVTRLHDGHIDVENGPGVGSTFRLHFPTPAANLTAS
jgi:signal transduction histidine kinase